MSSTISLLTLSQDRELLECQFTLVYVYLSTDSENHVSRRCLLVPFSVDVVATTHPTPLSPARFEGVRPLRTRLGVSYSSSNRPVVPHTLPLLSLRKVPFPYCTPLLTPTMYQREDVETERKLMFVQSRRPLFLLYVFTDPYSSPLTYYIPEHKGLFLKPK